MLHSAVCHMLRSTVLFHVQYGMFAVLFVLFKQYLLVLYVIYQVLLYLQNVHKCNMLASVCFVPSAMQVSAIVPQLVIV